MTIVVQPVILCGGSGSRLWPLSRAGFPKQFLSLMGKESLFQQAAQRLSNLNSSDISLKPSLIIAGENHRFILLEQMREAGIEFSSTILEPVSRNTAPALSMAALSALESDDPILVVIPADQVIADSVKFNLIIREAIDEASNDSVVVLGIPPSSPHTGYGYIQVEQDMHKFNVQTVKNFIEKPNQENAQAYIQQGGYYWNAGIFVLKASVWLKALGQFRSDILEKTQVAWDKKIIDEHFVRPGMSEFVDIPAESIDYAVIEKCPNSNFKIKMIPLDAGWNDLGSWEAIWKSLPRDDDGNSYTGDVLATDCCNTLAYATNRLVSLVGVKDVIVVETPDAVLVVDRSRTQDIKTVVNFLDINKRKEHNFHRKVHRPWGWYDSVDEGDRFKVKRIKVNPRACLSLQRHQYRAEHWIVVKGIAEITNGDEVIILTENQSTYIPLGQVHRLKNPGTIPLEIIEVQSGEYLGEDDIVRLSDSYGRVLADGANLGGEN